MKITKVGQPPFDITAEFKKNEIDAMKKLLSIIRTPGVISFETVELDRKGRVMLVNEKPLVEKFQCVVDKNSVFINIKTDNAIIIEHYDPKKHGVGDAVSFHVKEQEEKNIPRSVTSSRNGSAPLLQQPISNNLEIEH